MGQTIGRMPDTWYYLIGEKCRVLYWSGEVLAKVVDNVNQEESFQIDYGEDSIDRKIESWIQVNRSRIDKILSTHPNAPTELKIEVTNELTQIMEKFKTRMRNDYRRAYMDIEKLTREVDKLGKQQRKIHGKIHDLESICDGDVKKFQKKFGPLRAKTFKNLRTGEKMMFKDKKLKAEFIKRACYIDHKNLNHCAKCVDKLIKSVEKAKLD